MFLLDSRNFLAMLGRHSRWASAAVVAGLIYLAAWLTPLHPPAFGMPRASATEPRAPALIELGEAYKFNVNGPHERPVHDSLFDSADRPTAAAAAKATSCAPGSPHPDTEPAQRRHGGQISISETAGECFYEITWANADGQVEYQQGTNHLHFDGIFNIMGTADPSNGLGITDWWLQFAWGQPRGNAMDTLLAQLRAAGWKRYISPDDPRLSGHDAYRYGLRSKARDDPTFNAFEHDDFTGHDTYSLDSATPLSEDERHRIDDATEWEFYKDDVYIIVGRTWGVRIRSAADFYADWFPEPEDKVRWRDLLPAELAKSATRRQTTEMKLRHAGYTIDESYEAPAIERASR